MALNIQYTGRARKDQQEILQFFTQRNGTPEYSRKLAKHFRNTISLLAETELEGKSTDEPKVWQVIVLDYAIFYTIDSDRLIVLAIWDNRRNPDERPY
jgi:toxin YoeB